MDEKKEKEERGCDVCFMVLDECHLCGILVCSEACMRTHFDSEHLCVYCQNHIEDEHESDTCDHLFCSEECYDNHTCTDKKRNFDRLKEENDKLRKELEELKNAAKKQRTTE